MKTLTLNLFAILVLLTSCNNTKKEETTNTEKVKTEIKKEAISLENTKWKLTTLLGKDVGDKNAFITLSTQDNRTSGNAGCNTFSGTYEIKEGNRITISKTATTMMACEDMTIETTFLGILEKVDNYSLLENKMTLNKAKMAPLAVFEAVK